LSKFRLGQDYVRTFHHQLLDAANSHLQEFYEQLLTPLEPHLKDADHLIVAPHDFLHYLPFHALPGADGVPIGERFSFSYAPSASVYYLCASKPAPPAGGALVLGVPDPVAPQILDEVRAVSGVLGEAEVYIGPEATDEVLRRRGPASRLVHIA